MRVDVQKALRLPDDEPDFTPEITNPTILWRSNPRRVGMMKITGSLGCFLIYLLVTLLCLAMLVLDLSRPATNEQNTSLSRQQIELFIEILITLLLIGEVVYLFILSGCLVKTYLESWSNRIDIFVLVLSIALYVAVGIEASRSKNWDSLSAIDRFLLSLRYISQLLRIAVFMHRSRISGTLLYQPDIDFSELELELQQSQSDNGLEDTEDSDSQLSEIERKFNSAIVYSALTPFKPRSRSRSPSTPSV